MPWCPICKNEYYEGVKVCADCQVELVDSLEEERAKKKSSGFLSEDDKLRLAYVQKVFDEDVDMDSEHDVNDILQAFEDTLQADPSEYEGEELDAPSRKGRYKNYAERAEDNKSSAATLILVGGIGLVALVLILCDVIKVPLNLKSNYMLTGVMGAMFLVFFIMGIISAKNAKEYARKAVAEADLTSEIRKWCEENLDKETMDIKLFSEEELSEDALSEEQKYFKRFEEIKSRISENFLNLDEGYLNRFVDEYYPVIFEDSEQS